MSNGYWQIKRQTEQFGSGGTLMEKIGVYCLEWEKRCYKNGIPDSLPPKLAKTGRVPSWQAIAMCILKNDLQLRGIGFGRTESKTVTTLLEEKKRRDSPQASLF